MSEKGKVTVTQLREAIKALPENKREWLVGYAEGVADTKASQEKDKEE